MLYTLLSTQKTHYFISQLLNNCKKLIIIIINVSITVTKWKQSWTPAYAWGPWAPCWHMGHKEKCRKNSGVLFPPTVSLAKPSFPIGCSCPASMPSSFFRLLKCVGSHAPVWHRLITCSGDPINELSILFLNSCRTTDVFILQEKLHNMQKPKNLTSQH